MSRYFRPPPALMRFVVVSTEGGTLKRLGHVSLSAEEGFDPLSLGSHQAIADIEKAAYHLRNKYIRREACGTDLRQHNIRIEQAES